MPKFLLLVMALLINVSYSETLPLNFNFNSFLTDQALTLQKLSISYPIPSNQNPCGFKSYCGEAVNFKSETELKAFTDTNCRPLYRFLPLELQSTAQAPADFSGTNNQETNVDEADVLKTDGEFIYSVSGTVLSIIKAYPYQQVNVTSTIKFENAPSSIFIEGDYLAVFGTAYQNQDFSYYGGISGARMAYFYFRPVYTWVNVYNICDKFNPRLVKNYKFEGSYIDGRKTANGFVYLLSSLNCNGRESPAPWYNFGSGKKIMTPQQIFYYPGNDYQSANFINILAFNLKNPLFCDQNIISVLALNTYVIYMSDQYIYLTGTQYLADVQKTSIHKIFVQGSLLIPFADGKVEGTVNNQFSLDEFNGTLRIATTQTGITGQPSNSVFCLNSKLDVVGVLRNIAIGERIFSSRYVDNRLYLVTFRQIDPFFVIDLSNPMSPTILGELKISGFSRYLHPYDNSTIIGFGRQTNEQGQQQGLKISMFDVSDVNNPISISDFVLQDQYAYSTAEWQHKAFLFSKEKNLLVIPASYYNSENSQNQNSYNGALVFHIKRQSFGGNIQLRGIINHIIASQDEFWNRSVQRSLYIENLIYTKSKCLLRINTLSQLNTVVNVPLSCDF